MTRRMYDSTSARDIPTNAQMVAGYISGGYAWSAADFARFPSSTIKLTIATLPQFNADILDVEWSDATPQQAPGWALRQRARGADPTVYIQESNWQVARQEFANQRVAEPHWWIAAYDNTPIVQPGAVAHQYADPPASGGHYDVSVCLDSWPASAVPKPIPFYAQGDEMLVRNATTGSVDVFTGGRVIHVGTQVQLARLQAAGYALIDDVDLWNACMADVTAFNAALAHGGGGSNTPLTITLTGTAHP